MRAARVGGRLAGMSAAGLHGLWMPRSDQLTVEVAPGANRLRDPDDDAVPLGDRTDVRILWTARPGGLARTVGVVPLPRALEQVVLLEPVPLAVAVLDCAWRRGLLDRIGLERVILSAPPRKRALLALADGRPESGTESILRVLLRQVGIVAEPQLRLPGTDLERADFLVGDRLIIECDSEAHHGGREQRLRDPRRDAVLAAFGFVVLRFDYRQVMFEPESVVSAVLEYVRLGLHRS